MLYNPKQCLQLCLCVEIIYLWPLLFIYLFIAISEYKKSLEDAISGDTSGHFRRLLISLAQVDTHDANEPSQYFALNNFCQISSGICCPVFFRVIVMNERPLTSLWFNRMLR